MDHYAGIDVSLDLSSVCVVDATGRIVREAKVASEPEALIGWLRGLGLDLARVGLEAGPLSQWLYVAMRDAGLAAELLRPGTYGMLSRRCRSRPTAPTRAGSHS
jgi:transposase